MSLISRSGSLFVLAALLGCGSDSVLRPPAELHYAVALNACGPADGPAVAIFLTQDPVETPNPAPPYVGIYIDLSNGQLDGRVRSVKGGNEATAWFQFSASPQEEASDGVVIATYSSTENTIDGSVDMTFPSAGHITHDFHAPLFPMQGVCP